MANDNIHTMIEERSADIYKALFCQLYFPELQKFLSDFSISPTDKTETSTSLNMEFLLEAYDRSTKKESAKQQAKNDCHWQLCDIRESDLMLAIEEFFHISNQKVFVGDREEPLSAERNQLLYYLFHNSQMEQIRLGDDLLRAILSYFGIQLDRNRMEAGGMAKSFENFCKQVNGKYGNFSQAILLHADLRNWQGHKHLPRFQGMELHLYHRYVLYAYIGLVYVCRRIWEDEACNKEDLFNRGYLTCKTLEPFKMPTQKVHVKVSSPDVDIKKCDVRIGTKKAGVTIPYAKDILPNKNPEFDIEVRKYEPFILRITREGDDLSPFSKTLNYQSWFLTYDITLPKIIKSKYAESEEEPTGAVFLELLSAVESKDEALRMIVVQEMDKIKDLWIASVTSELEKDRQNYKNDLQKAMASMIDVVNSNQTDIEEKIKSIGCELSKRLNAYYLLLKELKNEIEKINKRTRKLEIFSSWSACLVLIFLAWLPLLYHKFDRIDTFVWCSQYKWIYYAWLLPLLSALAFAFFKSGNSWTGKIKQISNLQWIGIVFTIVPLIWITILICSAKSFVKDYDFSSADSNERMAEFMEKYLLETDDVKQKELLAIKLGNYYLDYENNVVRAASITKFMLDDIEIYPEGSLCALKLLYKRCLIQDKDFNLVKDIIKKYGAVIDNRPTTVNWIEGHMFYYGKGYDPKSIKGEQLIRSAADQRDSYAQYWEGRIRSYVTHQWKNEEGTDTLFNINTAIHYYTLSSQQLPEASLELGKLYADLNMTAEAEKWLKDALDRGRGEVYAEANYRLGLLLKNNANDYINKAKECGYKPAFLYKAKCDSDLNAEKDYYKSSGNYNGHKYIPPIVLTYLAMDSIGRALETLKETRPACNFNDAFVNGAKQFITAKSDKDSINGMSLMRMSANQGCYYAKMICIYRDLREAMARGDYSLSSVDSLHIIADRYNIIFSNILASDLYQEKGRYYESIKDIKAARREYVLAEESALRAVKNGHPAGIILLGDMRLAGFNFQYNQLRNTSIYLLKSELSWHHLLLRFFKNKYYSIAAGVNVDRLLGATGEYLIPNKDFWINVAIANHHFEEECGLLTCISDDENETVRAVINAALKDVSVSSDKGAFGYLKYRINVLAKHSQFAGYVDYLKQQYKDDSFKTELFQKVDIKALENTPIKIKYSWINKKIVIDNQQILNELTDLNDIDERLYDRPF